MASLVVAFLALFLVGLTYAESPMRLGGFGDVRPASRTVQKAVDAVASQIKTKANLPRSATLNATKYISQTVSGINYIVEIQAGNGRSAKVIHASISSDFKGKFVILNGVKNAIIGDRLRSF